MTANANIYDDRIATVEAFPIISRRFRKIAKNHYYLRHICVLLSVRPSVSLSVSPHGTEPPMDGFSQNFIFEYFSKICRKKSSLI